MTPSLGPDLKAWRTAAGLTQDAVAKQLGVSRPTITQWERGTYRPSREHLAKLDQLYGAQGELIRSVEGQSPDGGGESARHLHVADIFQGVADALVKELVVGDDGRPKGWSRNLVAESPGPLSTAYVVRTLQILDEVRVDFHSVGDFLEQRRGEAGWGYRFGSEARPEVTAVVLAALARLGRLTDVDDALRQLDDIIDPFAKSRPFVLAVVLEAVLAMRPDSELAHQLTSDLLKSRTRHHDRMLWTMNPSARLERTSPSLAHTARATAILRLARPTTTFTAEVDEAIDMAVEWMSSPHKSDVGAIELLEVSETRPSIPNHHFTSAWVIRSLAGVKGVPASRLQAALDTLWESYSPTDKLWIWRDEGSLPSWMTHDAVSALRAMTEASLLSPFSVSTGGDES